QKNPEARPKSVAQMLEPLGMMIDKHGSARIDPHAEDRPILAEAVPATVTDAPRPVKGPVKGPVNSEGEPLATAVRKSADDLSRWWNDRNLHPTARLVVVVVAAVILMMNSAWLIPMLSLLAILYIP